MKRILMIALLMAIAIAANAMGFEEARLMTDRMAVELRLSHRQYREVYDINLRHAGNPVARDHALSRVLTRHQMAKYLRDRCEHMRPPLHPAKHHAPRHNHNHHLRP